MSDTLTLLLTHQKAPQITRMLNYWRDLVSGADILIAYGGSGPVHAAGLAEDQARVAPPCAMVIFGAAGDLTKRLLVPALYDLVRAKRLPDQFRLLGVATRPQTTTDWCRELVERVKQFVGTSGGEFHADRLDEAAWGWLTERMTYLSGDLNDPDSDIYKFQKQNPVMTLKPQLKTGAKVLYKGLTKEVV